MFHHHLVDNATAADQVAQRALLGDPGDKDCDGIPDEIDEDNDNDGLIDRTQGAYLAVPKRDVTGPNNYNLLHICIQEAMSVFYAPLNNK